MDTKVWLTVIYSIKVGRFVRPAYYAKLSWHGCLCSLFGILSCSLNRVAVGDLFPHRRFSFALL